MVFFPGFCEKYGHSAPIHKIWFCLFLRTPNIVKDMKNFLSFPHLHTMESTVFKNSGFT